MANQKTKYSRFDLHDDVTAPAESLPLLRSLLSHGAKLPNLLAGLAGSPPALRAYVRMRHELRNGSLDPETRKRIALGVAARYGSEYGLARHTAGARELGLRLDEIALAKELDSYDRKESALLRYVRSLIEDRGKVPHHLHEQARERGWSEAQLLEAIAQVALVSYTSMVELAGDLPADRELEELLTADRRLRAMPTAA